MVRKIALALVVLVVAACGSQAGKPKQAAESAATQETTAASAGPEQTAAPAEPGAQPVTTPDGKATTLDEAVKGAASTATPAAKSGASGANPSSAPAGTKKDDSAPGPASAAGSAPTPGASSGGPAPAPGEPGAVISKKVTAKGQGFTDTTIKIGSTFPLSGAIAFVGQQGAGAIDAYIKMVNARGGIQGRKLQLISYDDGFDPAQVVANVKRLWEQDKVAMIFSLRRRLGQRIREVAQHPLLPVRREPGEFLLQVPHHHPGRRHVPHLERRSGLRRRQPHEEEAEGRGGDDRQRHPQHPLDGQVHRAGLEEARRREGHHRTDQHDPGRLQLPGPQVQAGKGGVLGLAVLRLRALHAGRRAPRLAATARPGRPGGQHEPPVQHDRQVDGGRRRRTPGRPVGRAAPLQRPDQGPPGIRRRPSRSTTRASEPRTSSTRRPPWPGGWRPSTSSTVASTERRRSSAS